MDRFKKLSSGEISWSGSLREYFKERERKDECIYCGRKGDLTLEHILPRSRGGLDSPDNAFLFAEVAILRRVGNGFMNGLALKTGMVFQE